jgi:hypothetical protein
MADTQVLGTCVFGRAGSSPASRTHLWEISQSRKAYYPHAPIRARAQKK